MGIIKRKNSFAKDTKAIAPIIWAIVLIGGAVVGLAGYKTLLEKPDITYNISDSGFTLAGVEIGNDVIIIIIIAIVIVGFILWSRKKPETN